MKHTCLNNGCDSPLISQDCHDINRGRIGPAKNSLFFFSRSLSLLMTSRRLTLSLSALKPPPNMMIGSLWTIDHERNLLKTKVYNRNLQSPFTFTPNSAPVSHSIMWAWPTHRSWLTIQNDSKYNISKYSETGKGNSVTRYSSKQLS